MKQRTRFSGLLAILCLLAFTAAGQSYTIHFIKGTYQSPTAANGQ